MFLIIRGTWFVEMDGKKNLVDSGDSRLYPLNSTEEVGGIMEEFREENEKMLIEMGYRIKGSHIDAATITSLDNINLITDITS